MSQMLMKSWKLPTTAITLFTPETHHPRFIYNFSTPIRRPFTLHSHWEATSSPVLKTTDPSQFTSSVGSPAILFSQFNLTQRHILFLNVLASSVAISATWLFLSAIPALLALKRAAESLEKLMDVTREELPDTMAAIRLSGMEISDLTMELSDLGQGITQGVKNSTQAVRVVEQSLRQFTTKDPSASLQRITSPKTEVERPALARKVRSMRDGIVKGRAIFQTLLTVTRFSRMLLNYFARKRAKQ